MTRPLAQVLRRGALAAAVGAVALVGAMAPATAEDVGVSLSDVRSSGSTVSSTLILRTGDAAVDPGSIRATLAGTPAPVKVSAVPSKPPSTMLVIDTSGSMGSAGMATVRESVKEFLAAVPKDVLVGVVSFANTSGVDVAPTTDRAEVQSAVNGLRSRGETSLYSGIQDAVKALGTAGERSIVLLSDGGDTVASLDGGQVREGAQRQAALNALARGKVRAEVVAFNSPESNASVLKAFAKGGGGSVAAADNKQAAARAFQAAARALDSQVTLQVTRPPGIAGDQQRVVQGSSGGKPFTATTAVDLTEAGPGAGPTPSRTTLAGPQLNPAPLKGTTFSWMLPGALLALVLGAFLIVALTMLPARQGGRRARVSAIEGYALGATPQPQSEETGSSAISQQLVQLGDRVMEGRESTTRTMALLDRADLPWRAGEWLVLRLVAVVVGTALGYFLLRDKVPLLGLVLGLVLGIVLPAAALRFLAKRRAKRFESVLPDVMMLTATSLASGFSLMQALDAVAKDAPEPAAKEFSRALALTRIGADVSDALEQMAARMDSANMRWATMAIRIQREVGGNLAETLRTTAATLREREMLKRQVTALSAEGRLSAYILIVMPVALLLYSMWRNYDYVSLLWTTPMGLVMSVGGIVAMVAGIFWMRKVVQIEV
ncbi:MAG: type II secretion system F family protein [Ornithinibacter sp.]